MKRYLMLMCAWLTLVVPLVASERPTVAIVAQTKDAEKSHWLTVKSGIRHNSKCKHYRNSKGRPCTKDEGRACKICGG